VCGDEGSEESGMFDKALSKNICYTCFKEKYPNEQNYWYDRLGNTKASLNKSLWQGQVSISTDNIERSSSKPLEAVNPPNTPNKVSPPSQSERPLSKPRRDNKPPIQPITSKEEISDKNRKLALIAVMLFVPVIAFMLINYHKLSNAVPARQIQMVDTVNDITSVRYSAFSSVPMFEADQNNRIGIIDGKRDYSGFPVLLPLDFGNVIHQKNVLHAATKQSIPVKVEIEEDAGEESGDAIDDHGEE
jgi:hypothetical protein